MSQWRAGAGGAASLASVYRLWCRSEQRPGRCGGAGRGGALRTVAAVSRATPGVRPAPPHVLLVPEVTLRPPPPPLHTPAWRMEDIIHSTEQTDQQRTLSPVLPVTQNDFYMIQFLYPMGSLVLRVVRAVNGFHHIHNFLEEFFYFYHGHLTVYLSMSGTGGTIHFNSTCTSAHWPGWDVCHITDRSNMQQISNFQN